jgi:hypothetical protein
MIKRTNKKVSLSTNKHAGRRQLQSASQTEVSNSPDREELTPSSPEGKGMLAMVPSLNNASVIQAFQSNVMGKDADLGKMIEMLEMSIKSVSNDDLSDLEAMLVGQANALQTIFVSLARRAAFQEQLPKYQTYMALALKAQSQSRATISALVDMKHPRQASFFGQTNLTTGPQQVNNVIHSPSKDLNSKNTPNQLSGVSNELHKDQGAQSLKSGINSTLEAVGKVNRAKNIGG